MGDYSMMTKHPITGEMQMAEWCDNHFGPHRYGVRFPDGRVFRESEIQSIEINGVSADATPERTNVKHWDRSQDSRTRKKER